MLLIFVPRPNGSINIPSGIYEDVGNLCALFFPPPLIGQLVHRYKIETMTSPSIYLLTKGKIIIKTGFCVKKKYYILEHKEKNRGKHQKDCSSKNLSSFIPRQLSKIYKSLTAIFTSSNKQQ